MVVILAAARDILVVERKRIALVDNAVPQQPYHAAQTLTLEEAARAIARSEATALRLARTAIRTAAEDASARDERIAACGVLLSSAKPKGTLAATLASHALIHSAEGQLFRDALARASESAGLATTAIKEKELFERGAAALRRREADLRRRIDSLGREIGAPWTQDEKWSALAAWIALAEAR